MWHDTLDGLRRALTPLICWAQGHNLVGVDLPTGWSQQRCLTCGRMVEAFKR
jgi:hypothetical protein